MKDIRNYQLLKHNTFGIDAACKRFVEFTTESELVHLLQRERFQETGEPLLILGGGSNLLLTGDFEGTVLHSAIMGIEDISAIEGPQSDSVLLRVGSGVVWDDFVAYCVVLARWVRVLCRTSAPMALKRKTLSSVWKQ